MGAAAVKHTTRTLSGTQAPSRGLQSQWMEAWSTQPAITQTTWVNARSEQREEKDFSWDARLSASQPLAASLALFPRAVAQALLNVSVRGGAAGHPVPSVQGHAAPAPG